MLALRRSADGQGAGGDEDGQEPAPDAAELEPAVDFYMAKLSYQDMQKELKSRRLPAVGNKQVVSDRLRAVLLEEAVAAVAAALADEPAPEPEEAEVEDEEVTRRLPTLEEVEQMSYREMQITLRDWQQTQTGTKAQVTQRLQEFIIKSQLEAAAAEEPGSLPDGPDAEGKDELDDITDAGVEAGKAGLDEAGEAERDDQDDALQYEQADKEDELYQDAAGRLPTLEEVERMPYRDIQVVLRDLQQPDTGTKAQVIQRLQEIIIQSQLAAAGAAAAQDPGSLPDGLDAEDKYALDDLYDEGDEAGEPERDDRDDVLQYEEADEGDEPYPDAAGQDVDEPWQRAAARIEGQGGVFGGGAAAEEDEGELPGDLESVMAELMKLSPAELQEALGDRGASTEGTLQQLARRLTLIMAKEEDEGMLEDEGMQQAEPDEYELEDQEAQQQFAGGPRGFSLTDAERATLLADLVARRQEDYQGIGRGQLFKMLKEALPGQSVPYLNKDDLAAQLAALRAEAELTESIEAAVAGDAAVAAELRATLSQLVVEEEAATAAEDPAPEVQDEWTMLAGMSVTDVRSMRVSDVRAALRRLGVDPADRNSYELKDMLLEAVAAKRAELVEEAGGEGLFEQVSNMTMRELRAELSKRGLPSGLSKVELRAKLMDALTKEQPTEEEQGEGDEGDEGEEEDIEDQYGIPVTMPYNMHLVHNDDPPIRIAVVCGAPGGTPGQAELSLSLARMLFDHLHSARLPDASATAPGTALEHVPALSNDDEEPEGGLQLHENSGMPLDREQAAMVASWEEGEGGDGDLGYEEQDDGEEAAEEEMGESEGEFEHRDDDVEDAAGARGEREEAESEADEAEEAWAAAAADGGEASSEAESIGEQDEAAAEDEAEATEEEREAARVAALLEEKLGPEDIYGGDVDLNALIGDKEQQEGGEQQPQLRQDLRLDEDEVWEALAPVEAVNDVQGRYEVGERGTTVDVYYFDSRGRAHALTPAQLLGLAGGTAELEHTILLEPGLGLSKLELVDFLRHRAQVVLPVLNEGPVPVVTPSVIGRDADEDSMRAAAEEDEISVSDVAGVDTAAIPFTALLEAADIPFVGTPVLYAAAAADKWRLNRCLAKMGYPAMPSFRVRQSDLAAPTAAWLQNLVDWCKEQNLDPSLQVLAVKPANASGGRGLTPARGLLRAAQVATELLGAPPSAFVGRLPKPDPLLFVPDDVPSLYHEDNDGAAAAAAGAAAGLEDGSSQAPVQEVVEERAFGRFPFGTDEVVLPGGSSSQVDGGAEGDEDGDEGEEEAEEVDVEDLWTAPRIPYTLDNGEREEEHVEAVGGAAGGGSEPGRSTSGDGASGTGVAAVVIEPWMRRPAVEFSCVVIDGEEGPVALMPTEIEMYDPHHELIHAQIEAARLAMMQNGVSAAGIERAVAEMTSAAALHPLLHTFSASRTYLPQQVIKYHSPPRFSRSMVHHIRHAAALLFQELRLRDVARIDGWVDLVPGWQSEHERDPTLERSLPDKELHMAHRFASERTSKAELRDEASMPLSAYYDEAGTYIADLDRFDPQRLHAQYNGEGSVIFTDVNTHAMGLDAGMGRALMLHQAAEVGIPPTAILRNLVNSALKRAGLSSNLQLPPTPPLLREETAPLVLTISSPEPDDEEMIARVARVDLQLDEVDEYEKQQMEQVFRREQAALQRKKARSMVPQFEAAEESLMDAIAEEDDQAALTALNTLVKLDNEQNEDWTPQFDEVTLEERAEARAEQREMEEEIESGLTDDEIMELRLGHRAMAWRDDWEDVEMLRSASASPRQAREAPDDNAEKEDTSLPSLSEEREDEELPGRRVGGTSEGEGEGEDEAAHAGEGEEEDAMDVLESIRAAAREAGEAEPELSLIEAGGGDGEAQEFTDVLVHEPLDDAEVLRPGETQDQARWRVWAARDARRLEASDVRRQWTAEGAFRETTAELAVDAILQDAERGDTRAYDNFMLMDNYTGWENGELGQEMSMDDVKKEMRWLEHCLKEEERYNAWEEEVDAEIAAGRAERLEQRIKALSDKLAAKARSEASEKEAAPGEAEEGELVDDADDLDDDEIDPHDADVFRFGVADPDDFYRQEEAIQPFHVPAEEPVARLPRREPEPMPIEEDEDPYDLDTATAAIAPADDSGDASSASAEGDAGASTSFSSSQRQAEGGAQKTATQDSEEVELFGDHDDGWNLRTAAAAAGVPADYGLDPSEASGRDFEAQEDEEDEAEYEESGSGREPQEARVPIHLLEDEAGDEVAFIQEPLNPALRPDGKPGDEDDDDGDDGIDAPPDAPRVWVLMGGGGDARAASLAAGANVISKLGKYSDILVEPFLLAMSGGASEEQRRRTALIQRRNERLSIGFRDASGPGWGFIGDDDEQVPMSFQEEEYDDGTGGESVSQNPTEVLSAPLRLPNLLNMRPVPSNLETQHVWALTPAAMARPTVSEVQDYCERALKAANTPPLSMTPLQRQAAAVRAEVQEELASAGISGVGSLWGPMAEAPHLGDYLAFPTPPRMLSLDQFAEEARKLRVTVLLALRGGGLGNVGDTGMIQSLLESHDVPFTGPNTTVCMTCCDKLMLADVLGALEEFGVLVPPRRSLATSALLAETYRSPERTDAILHLLRGELGVADTSPLCFKPAMGAGGVGLAQIVTFDDLMTYTQALRVCAPFIPADSLSYLHAAVAMPQYLPQELVVEPWVETEPVLLLPPLEDGESSVSTTPTRATADDVVPPALELLSHDFAWDSESDSDDDEDEADEAGEVELGEGEDEETGAAGEAEDEEEEEEHDGEDDGVDEAPPQPRIQWSGGSPWVEVTMTIMGAQGMMQVLPVSVKAQAQREGAAPGRLPTVYLTPPPPSIIPTAVLEAAVERALLITDRLGAHGVMTVDAFLSVDSGELIVIDVNSTPDLSESSVIFQQALAIVNGRIYPDELLRAILALANQAKISDYLDVGRDDDEGEEGGEGDDLEGDDDDDDEDELLEELEQMRTGSGGTDDGLYDGGVWDGDAFGGDAEGGDADDAAPAGSWSQL